MKRQNIRTLSLIVCTLTYLLVGAAVFDALESEQELRLRNQAEKTRSQLISKYNITSVDYEILEAIIVKSIPHKAGHQWKFSGAFYFATTVITTIGYGHSTPSTIGGKCFCILYALAGIPLGLVMFQSIGERLNTFAAKVLRFIKRCFGRAPNVSHVDLIGVCTTLSLFIILIGARVFQKYENWTYFDSIYYCFTTLVTVGFGDFVALQKHGALQSQPEYVIFSLIFIVSGLTVISAAMNLLVLRFLTLNTIDEKRDQREQKLAARGFVSINNLRGRRKYSRSSSSLSDTSSLTDESPLQQRLQQSSHLLPKTSDGDAISVCSCSCYQVPYNKPQLPPERKHRRSKRRKSSGRQKSIEHLNDLTVSIPPVMISSPQSEEKPLPRLSIDRPEVFERRKSGQQPLYGQQTFDETQGSESKPNAADLLLRGKTSQI
ncbi:hypothetical protein M3Y97_00599500 [Aphelenchoides bicaudatus]|nr:hypothetical protein M3Y97_00599500 [Aphelenchoides bicaudatus]